MGDENRSGTLPTAAEIVVPDQDNDLSVDQQVLFDSARRLPDLDSRLRELLRFTGDNAAAQHARLYYVRMPGDTLATLLLKVLLAAADPLTPRADKRRLVNFCRETLPRYFIQQKLALPRKPGPSATFAWRERQALREAYKQLLAVFQKQKRVTGITVADVVARCLPDREAAIRQRAETLQDRPGTKTYLRVRAVLAYVCEVSPDLIAKLVAGPRRPQ